jgi:hypothetical protein
VTISEPFVTPPPQGKLRWAAVDLDGTLAQPVWTAEHPTADIGDPIPENVEKVRALHASGDWDIVVHTARGWTDYRAIKRWLIHHDIPYMAIVCGKLLAGVYIDDRNVDVEAPDWSNAESLRERDREDGYHTGWREGRAVGWPF